MDPSFLNNPIFRSIPKEKQQFLQAFAARSHTGTANELASQLSSAAMEARSKGLTFTDAETTLLIGMLKQNMSPEEQKKADRIIQLVHTFRPH